MRELDEIRERLERFLVMKSLVDGAHFKIQETKHSIRIFKDDEIYLAIENTSYRYSSYDSRNYKMTIFNIEVVDYLRKKYNYQYIVHGEGADEMMMFIEKYMMDA